MTSRVKEYWRFYIDCALGFYKRVGFSCDGQNLFQYANSCVRKDIRYRKRI